MSHHTWQEQINKAVRQFLKDWKKTDRPAITKYLPPEEPLRLLVLVELVLADLEVSIRHGCAAEIIQDHGTVTQSYFHTFPELACCRTVVSDLFSREFRCRRGSGEQLSWIAFRESVDGLVRDSLTPYSSAAFIKPSDDPEKPLDITLSPGAEFDNFTMIEKLGEGGFAKVWLARHLERFVALKIPKAWDDDWTKEASLLSGMEHDHIVNVYDARVLESVGFPVLVMQYHPGGCLRNVIDQIPRSWSERSGETLRNTINGQLENHGEDLLPAQASDPNGTASSGVRSYINSQPLTQRWRRRAVS